MHKLIKTKPDQSQSVRDKFAFFLLISIVAIAPLPLGSNSPFSVSFLTVLASGALMCWAVSLGLGTTRLHTATRAIRWPVSLYLVVCAVALIQWLPWAPSQFAAPNWKIANDLLTIGLPNRITVNPDATIAGLINFLLYGSVFWLTFQMTQTPARARSLIRCIAYIGCAYATYGVIIYMTGNEWVGIHLKTSYLNSLTSTFVNQNSYATFAGLSLLCACALLLEHMKPYFALKHVLRTKLAIIIEEMAAKSALKTLAVLSISISLFLSASRAGIFSSAVGLTVFLMIFLSLIKLKIRQKIYVAVTMVVLTGALLAISGNYFSKRLGTDDIAASYTFRAYMYSLTWDAIKTSPLTGTGLGTYADIIPAYKEDLLGAPLQRWDKAHNTYLENALELGLPTALALNFSILLVALIAAGGVSRRRRDKLIPALGVCATILVSLHSLVDFSLQIPAVAVLYACIMGVAASQSWSTTVDNTTHRGSASSPSTVDC